ncbi:S8 family serine peptidase [Primorskyibacter sp. 2E233]|uniref:S8 family serine peptidase n=1 Tax=Primorskyibacter sp. 2E233 TaxID=3413431 RepID=UPI003BF14F9D
MTIMNPMGTVALVLTLASTGVLACADTGTSQTTDPAAQAADPVTQEGDVTGQILIRFNDGVPEAQAQDIIAKIGGTVVSRMLDGKIYLIEIPYPAIQNDIIQALSSTEGVSYAEPNQRVSIPELPKSPDTVEDPSKLIPLPKVD